MLLTNLKLGLVGFGIGVAVATAATWTLVSKYQTAKYEAKIGKANEQAAEELKKAVDRAMEIERSYNALATEIEVQHATYQQELDQVLIDNRRLATELGGLRDPGRQINRCHSVPTDPEPTIHIADDSAPAFLSAEATEFLLEFAREADRAAEYAQTCQKWVQGLVQDPPDSSRVIRRTSF